MNDKCCCSCHENSYITLAKVDKEFTFITTKDGTKITQYSTDQFTTLALNGFVDDVEPDLLAYWGFLITTKTGSATIGHMTLVEFNEQYPNSKWNMDLQEFQNLVTITTVDNTTNISEYKSGDIILIKNMNTRSQDTGTCPDQLEAFDETLECDKCASMGSFFLIDEKYQIGYCYKCLLEQYNELNQVVEMNGEEIKDYNIKRDNECYDLWCHKGHLRNMDKNSYYQDRNGEVCNYDHPYQNAHDEMVGYYKIIDGVRFEYHYDLEHTIYAKDYGDGKTMYRVVTPDLVWCGEGYIETIDFETLSSLIDDGIVHHKNYQYGSSYKFTFTVNDMNSEQEAWDLLHKTLDECKVKDVFDCEKVEDESQ